MKTYDVVIVGGGVVGSAAAYYLRKQGFTGAVAIVEKDTTWQFGCTARSVGGLRQQFSTPENIALSTFGINLVKNLKQEFGPDADVGFKEQGYLICASPEGLPVLEENHAVQIANGADNVLLDGAGARRALSLAGDGWHRRRLLRPVERRLGRPLYAGRAVPQGGGGAGRGPHPGRGDGHHARGNRITGVTLASGEPIACGTLVNAAGAGAGKLAAMAGIALPVGPRKRYVYVIDCPAATEALRKAPLTVLPSGVYFRPEGRNFLCGLSPEEHEEPASLDWEVDHAWFEERIWPALAERVPLFEAIKVISAWVGHYDYNALDQNAVIGPPSGARQLPLRQRLLGPRPAAGPGGGQCHRGARHPRRLPHHRPHPLRLWPHRAQRAAVREERDLMRVLAVSSQVVWGPVGNSAAVPALQAAGHEVLAFPPSRSRTIRATARPRASAPSADDMARMLAALEALGALDDLDAVMTGYFASAGQVEEVARLLVRIEVPFLLVDPVMGDHGRLYVPEDVAEAIARHLVPRATCLTPNGFELARLSGMPSRTKQAPLPQHARSELPNCSPRRSPPKAAGSPRCSSRRTTSTAVTTARSTMTCRTAPAISSAASISQRVSIMPPGRRFAAAMKTLVARHRPQRRNAACSTWRARSTAHEHRCWCRWLPRRVDRGALGRHSSRITSAAASPRCWRSDCRA